MQTSSSTRASLTYAAIMMLCFMPVFFMKEKMVEPEVIIEITPDPLPEVLPDFANIPDVEEKKQTFFDFIEPYVDEVNEAIIRDRQQVLTVIEKLDAGEELTERQLRFLSTMAEKYELDTDDLLEEGFLALLLRRVDKIPASLALAQAANESAWGTSRFAQDGNNLFGQWCYTDGCGLVPSRRREGATHEVRRFDNIRDSVESYIHNLNTFPSYQMLRRIRQQLRQQDRPIDGVTLADGLESYSSRGLDYIAELQRMIYSNALLERDNAAL